jgi:hypothetical protein
MVVHDKYVHGKNKWFVEQINNVVRYIFFWIPEDKDKGLMLRTLHIGLLSILFLNNTIFFLLPKESKIRIYLYLFMLFLFISHMLFDGCLISYCERVMIEDRVTVIDWAIEATGENVNDNVLLVVTYLLDFVTVYFMSLVLLRDHYLAKK